MASLCVNNIPPENSFFEFPANLPTYQWLSPRPSFREESKFSALKPPTPAEILPKETNGVDPDDNWTDLGDFEFRLENPVTMLPADELFSDGKLMPLQISTSRVSTVMTSSSVIRSPEKEPKCSLRAQISSTDPYVSSPKAPRCSSKWKEFLGLRKLYQNNQDNQNSKSTPTSSPNTTIIINKAKSMKQFLHRSSKSSSDALNQPLLKDLSDCESVSISARLSLSSLSSSSSSSSHEHNDIPRLSLDIDYKSSNFTFKTLSNLNSNPPRVRLVKSRLQAPLIDHPSAPMRHDSIGVTADSPRMHPSGKIVFQNLGRSSSSPSSFNGGPRHKHRGVERSYSANVRVTPVLNVPVCSLRGSSKSGVFGFGQLFTSAPPKKDIGSSSNGGSNRGSQQSSSSNGKNRVERV